MKKLAMMYFALTVISLNSFAARVITGSASYDTPIWMGPAEVKEAAAKLAADQSAEVQCGGPARRQGDYQVTEVVVQRPIHFHTTVSASYVCVGSQKREEFTLSDDAAAPRRVTGAGVLYFYKAWMGPRPYTQEPEAAKRDADENAEKQCGGPVLRETEYVEHNYGGNPAISRKKTLEAEYLCE